MTEHGEQEFYVGYVAAAPARLAAFTRKRVLFLLALASIVAAALSAAHRRLPAAAFELGESRSLSGTLVEQPYPALLVTRPGSELAAASASRYHLVAPGKHGALDLVRGLDGHSVELSGTLVYRDGETMVEIEPGSVRDLGVVQGSERGPPRSLGRFTLRGEIVDSKCFLGVMNPGSLKTHKECATLCIRGGIPPLLCVRDAGERALYFLLVTEEGRAVNEHVLDLVAEPVEVTGLVERDGELLLLRADPATIRRLPGGPADPGREAK